MIRKMVVAAALVGACSFAPAPAPAQNPFAPPLDAMDELNSGPTGAPGPGFNPADRARNAVNAANNRPAANPFGGPAGGQANPFGGGANQGNNPFGAPAGGQGNPFGGGAGGFAPPGGGFAPPGQQGFAPAAPAIAKRKAWGGTRIKDARTGEILQDAKEIDVLETWIDNGEYVNDGKTKNDGAVDDIYTNITVVSNRISPESAVVRSKLIRTLAYTENLSPMEFFQVRVATTEPLSPLPKVLDLETDRDKALSEWFETFLGDYFTEDENGDRILIPTYIPPPPRAPNIPLPLNFTPESLPVDEEGNVIGVEGLAGGAGGGGGVTGAVRGRFGADDIPRQNIQDPAAGEALPPGGGQSRYF